MSIYNDVLAAQELIEQQINFETGEVTDEYDSAVELKEEIIALGLEKLCKVRANIKADIDAFKAEEKRLAERRKSLEKALERNEKYIMFVHKQSGNPKDIAGSFTVSTRKSESVELVDNFENKDFGRYEFKPDKTLIKQALKSGIEIDGAKIVVNENLSVR